MTETSPKIPAEVTTRLRKLVHDQSDRLEIIANASYLLGQTELLIGVKTDPDQIHRLLDIVTDFLVDWIALQAKTIDSIDGILLLDDLIGFLRDDEMLNVLNRTNFNAFQAVGTSFGQVTGAYNDLSGTFNPGGRVIEFLARLNF
jgi:hypothetical protein